jgi:hypothetical protein
LALHASMGRVVDVVAGIHVRADGPEAAVRGLRATTRQRVRSSSLNGILDEAALLLRARKQ